MSSKFPYRIYAVIPSGNVQTIGTLLSDIAGEQWVSAEMNGLVALEPVEQQGNFGYTSVLSVIMFNKFFPLEAQVTNLCNYWLVDSKTNVLMTTNCLNSLSNIGQSIDWQKCLTDKFAGSPEDEPK